MDIVATSCLRGVFDECGECNNTSFILQKDQKKSVFDVAFASSFSRKRSRRTQNCSNLHHNYHNLLHIGDSVVHSIKQNLEVLI